MQTFYMSEFTKQTIADYRTEYIRVNGQAPEMPSPPNRGWLKINGNNYRVGEIPKMTETLKQRPSKTV